MSAKTKKILANSFVYFILFLVYLPILFMVFLSFTGKSTIKNWNGFSMSSYEKLFQRGDVWVAVLNTLVIGLSSSLIATILGTITAIGIFHIRRKALRSVVKSVNQITIINADIVTAVAFMLLFFFLRRIGINIPDGFATLILTHTIITIPYVILAVLPRLSQINNNVYEAALDLGATPLRATFTVLLPQLTTAMVAGFMLAFTLSLDDFVVTKFNNGTVETISTLIYNGVVKKGMPPEYRALSSILLTVIMGTLLLINIRSRKSQKNSLKKQ